MSSVCCEARGGELVLGQSGSDDLIDIEGLLRPGVADAIALLLLRAGVARRLGHQTRIDQVLPSPRPTVFRIGHMAAGAGWAFAAGVGSLGGDAKNPHGGPWGFEASGSSQTAAREIT